MGTEVLRPQDCLLRSSPALRNSRPQPPPRQLRRRREGSPKQPAKPRLAMGQVTILRRGESLPTAQPKGDGADRPADASVGWDPAVFAVERLGPDPALIPKQIRLKPPAPEAPDEYAGSAFHLSPSPRALPLPTFSRTKEAPPAVDSSATKDLRRLLRLE
ncbi:uncharacterized protein LOC122040883 [Zingiber officinale]|uniref:Uncharacterized protein n=1 Tax=Zingiber officinale TaxID=94328 RepID=A0A8J5LYB8_ZINOF|nr:uncharacterized protein LOC122040883 [Zingiber officinale]KAG6527434.1 hypothetical protein ZIOFF_009536 [Zingiber officinale]